jgi:O-antigen ligase
MTSTAPTDESSPESRPDSFLPEIEQPIEPHRIIRIADSSLFIFLCSVIVLAPALYGSTDPPIRLALELSLFLGLSVLAIISTFGRTGARFHPVFVPVLIFAGYLVIQILPIVPGQQFGGIQWRTISINPPVTFAALVEFLSLCAGAYLTLALVNTKKRLILLVNIIVIAGFVLGMQAILQDLNPNEKLYWFRETAYPVLAYGGFVNKDHAAGYFELPYALGLGLLLRRSIRPNRRIIYALLTLITGVAVILSRSRGGLVSVVGASLVMLILNGALPPERLPDYIPKRPFRWITWKLVASAMIFLIILFAVALWANDKSLSLILGGFNQTDTVQSLGGRAEIWRSAVQMIKERPLLGAGLGTFGVNFPRFTLWDGQLIAEAAHNDYLQVLCDTGIVGAVIAIAAILFYLLNIKRVLWSTTGYLSGIQLGAFGGVAAILIHSLFDFNLHIYSVALTFSVFVILPFCVSAHHHKHRRARTKSNEV